MYVCMYLRFNMLYFNTVQYNKESMQRIGT